MANDTVVKTASKELDAADNAAVEAVQEGWNAADEIVAQAAKEAEAAPTVNMLEEVSTSFTVPQTELLKKQFQRWLGTIFFVRWTRGLPV